MAQQVGKRIALVRKARKLTCEEFGKLIGVSGQFVEKLERGSQIITGDVLVQICDKTGVSADYIMFGTVDALSKFAVLKGLNRAQSEVIFGIAAQAIEFINTEDGNNTLLKEVCRRQKPS